MGERKIIVYGASGHGKVVLDILLAAGTPDIAGFVDDGAEQQGKTVLGFRVLGDGAWLAEQAAAPGAISLALGIGNNTVRHGIAENLRRAGASLHLAVHPRATVSASALVGEGTVVMAGVVINPSAIVGEGVILNTCCVVEHDVVVGHFAHISPNATLGGGVHIGDFSHVGLGASILPGVRIGAHVIIGAGATVTRDLEDSIVAVGVPARVTRRLAI
jgi:sugar O-acyltransferase (sialic acid O-acetyltransferase NeuD family)